MGELIELPATGSDPAFPAYLAAPATGPVVTGGLVLIHEIWGLVDHIKDVADRLAGQGYWVIAPDILSEVGVTPEVGAEVMRLMRSPDEEERRRAQPRMRELMAPANAPTFAAGAVRKLQRALDHVAAQPGVNGLLGVLGFCFGGSYSFALAAADRRIRIAIPFYGSPPDLAAVGQISGQVLAFYGDQDERLMRGLPELEQAMAAAGVDFTAKVYPGARHAFFNDTSPMTYDAAPAEDAWRLTLERLRIVLGGR